MAKGTNPDGGGEIAPYDTATSGEVFSVGSINYPRSILVDDLGFAHHRQRAHALSHALR